MLKTILSKNVQFFCLVFTDFLKQIFILDFFSPEMTSTI